MLITPKVPEWKILKNVSFVVLLLNFWLVSAQEPNTKKVVVIDPGHGGKDSGAIGVNGIYEKDVVFKIARELIGLNRNVLYNELDVYLTRYGDTLVSLGDRGRLARALKADVFVSLHCNASRSTSRGMEVYVSKAKAATNKNSILLGQIVLNEATGKLCLKQRGIKSSNFQVLRETIAHCPSILVETGFVTNGDEACYFQKTENIRAMALAILMGIRNYFNTG